MDRFMELYEAVYKDLYYMAFYYLGNPQDAEDALSETVIKAYENFTSLRREDAFRAWIFKILVNQCKHDLKNRSSRTSLELVEEPSYYPSLEDCVITRELLCVLTEEERLIVVLSVFGGYKSREIAHFLDLQHSTVRSKYRRALKKLKKQLLAEEVQHEE